MSSLNRREAAFSEVSWYTEIRKIHVRVRSKPPKTQNSQLGGTIRPWEQPPRDFSSVGLLVQARELNFKPLSVDVLPREVVERWCYMACNLRLAVVSPVSRHGSTSDIAPYGLLDMNRLHSAWESEYFGLLR